MIPNAVTPWVIWLFLALAALLQGAVNFAEALITSLPRARLKSLKVIYGGPLWEAARRWINHPEEYLTLLLLANNMLEVWFTWGLLAGLSFYIQQDATREAIAWIAGGSINLFLLTIYPKVLGHKLSRGILGAWILRALHLVLVPLYPFFRFFFLALAKLSGAGPQRAGILGKGIYLSLEELREIMDAAKTQSRDGKFSADDWERRTVEMMANYLRLKEIMVKDVMTPKDKVAPIDWDYVKSSPPGSPQRSRAIFSLMTDGHTRTLVTFGGVPAGYIHAKDVLARLKIEGEDRLGAHQEEALIAEMPQIMRPIPALHAGQKLISVLPLLTRGSPLAYVTDGQAWVGIITIEDCLEEITGEILDEFEARKKLRHPPPSRKELRSLA
ncbi:MAG: DUF21 domain-containing protein [Elusimicrobia bacterium]|nr:DUF21 domain-containing protein [Elusimicrobiota bacterium]